MNIVEAAEAMRAGKWVARSTWKPTKRALFYDAEALDGDVCGFRAFDGTLGSHRGSFSRRCWELGIDDLEAADWEEVEPTC